MDTPLAFEKAIIGRALTHSREFSPPPVQGWAKEKSSGKADKTVLICSAGGLTQ